MHFLAKYKICILYNKYIYNFVGYYFLERQNNYISLNVGYSLYISFNIAFLIYRFWRLSVPIGETTDHPLVNPFGPNSPDLEKIDLDPILVIVGGCDLLKDRAEDYAKRLKEWGKKIEYVEFEGQQHGFFTIYPNSDPSKKLMLTINKFIQDNSS